MPMAPAATGPPPRLLSKSSFFLAPSPNAATTLCRLGRRVDIKRAVILGVAPRDGEWGADHNASSGSGRMVDEDMATLRRRIREARAARAKDDDDDADSDADAGVPAAGWTELERRRHGNYVVGVRGAACLLEALLVNAHPGVVALLLLGVPATVVFLVCANLMQAVDAISSAVHGR